MQFGRSWLPYLQILRLWTYCKVGKRQRNGRKIYLVLRYHYLGPNNVDHVVSATEKIIQSTVYYAERNNNTFESYITIQKEQRAILENLEEHGYKGIDER